MTEAYYGSDEYFALHYAEHREDQLNAVVLFIDSERLKTITVGLNALIQKADIAWGRMMAGTIIAILPTVLLFALLRKYMIAGLTSGAVKG